MKRHTPLLLTLLAGITVWACITWPLPAKFATAVPISDKASPGAERVVATTPGDHLQLLYHFWLAGEVIAGHMPPCSNVFEFNSAGDASRHEFSTHYVPFSLVYSATAPFIGRAGAWNVAGLFSVLLGIFGTFLLTRRLGGSDWQAFILTTSLAAFPYRWATLIAGSPTGFAMGLVPWFAYGIDRIVRDGSKCGSAIAGLALLFAFCSDLHAFYFCALSAPLFVIVSAADSAGGVIRRNLRSAALAFLPLFAFTVAALALSKAASSGLGSTAMASGRTLRETLLFSPVLRGLFTTRALEGATNSIYVGVAAGILFPLALARLALVSLRADDRRTAIPHLIAAAILAAGAFAAILLAAGAYGPINGLPFRMARAIVPKYTMIRQPAKIFCLMPTLLAMVAAISLRDPRRRIIDALCLGLALVMPLQQLSRFQTIVSRLDNPMAAYRATREAADAAGIANPKAVAIPIWPGDSHFASLYELGIMESRIRLVNGYSPSPPADYFDLVFKPLESINQGFLDYNQNALLRQMGVDFLIFHEDAFPDKVSPFPAGLSLATLWCNQYLEPLFQGDRVSAFRLRDSGSENGNKVPMTPVRSFLNYAPAQVWHPRQVARSLETASAPGRINLALRAPVFMHQGMRYMILDCLTGWHSIPLDNPMGGEYALPEGVTDPALIILAAGDEGIGNGAITPALMFHEGTSSIANGAALISADGNEKHSVVLEGPFVPIGAGHWRVKADVKGACANGAILEVVCGVRGETEVVASSEFAAVDGQDADIATVEFDWDATDPPFALRVSSRRVAPLEVRALRLIGIP